MLCNLFWPFELFRNYSLYFGNFIWPNEPFKPFVPLTILNIANGLNGQIKFTTYNGKFELWIFEILGR